MQKKYGYILDIGSSDVTLYGFCRTGSVSGCFYVGSGEHDGLNAYFFINPEHTASVIRTLLDECMHRANREVTDVYVLLPQRFFRSKTQNKRIPIKNETVNKFDVSEIVAQCDEGIEGCDFCETVPVAFRVGDDYIDNPIGQSADELEIVAVNVGVLTRIREFFDDLGKRLSVSFTPISHMHPILNRLQDAIKTNRSARVVINVFDDFYEICYCEMRAVVAMKSLDGGTKRFTNELSERFGLDESSARELLTHVNVNAFAGEYSIPGEENALSVRSVNSVVKSVLDGEGKRIAEAISSLTYGASLPVYVTGSKFCLIRGIEGYLTEKIGAPVTIVKPDHQEFNLPQQYATVGLLQEILYE